MTKAYFAHNSVLYFAMCSALGFDSCKVSQLSEWHAYNPVDHIRLAQIGWLCMSIMAAYKEGGLPEV